MRRAGLSILAIVQVNILLLHVNGAASAAAAAFLSDRWDADLVTHVDHPN